MTEFPLSDWVTRRLAALYQLEILDTPPEKEYDHIVALAAQICARPIATLGFMDHNRTWYKAKIGIDIQEDTTYPAYRNSVGADIPPIQIEDTLADPRSVHNPYVTGAPFVRSITIFPIVDESGDILGHLSVADNKPGALTAAQFNALAMLALQTVSLLKLRLQIIRMRQVQNQSKRTLDQISPVFKNAIDAVIVANHDGLICQWNPRAEVMFGFTAAEAIGKRFHQLLIPERKHERFLEERKKFKFNTSTVNKANFEFVAKRKDHAELVVNLGISSVMIDGEALFIGFLSDVTERKQIARELAKQKSFYEKILNTIPMDIAVFDADHKYLFLNAFAIKNEVYRNYIIGKDDFEYAAFRNRDNSVPLERRGQFLKAKTTRRVVTWEDQAINPEGNAITHLRRFFPAYNENENLDFVIGYGIDITERKVLEVEQNILVERLSFQNTQLFDFCNIVTHNLRGPLNNMSMLVEFIEDTHDPLEQKELVSKLKPVIESLKYTFNELVETIQIKQDLEIKSERVHLEDNINKTLTGLEMEVMKANARITVNCADAPDVYFPPKYVASIFHNLISNALKYRSPNRQLTIDIYTRKSGSSVFLTVADNGLGIDLGKHQDHVFKIGKVFHNHANAKGLGLYMTKTQVEVMGGRIHVESEVDHGARFTIEFKNQ
jgi:PAS domain S-box-containing protein